MKKTQPQSETYCLDQYIDHCNLWTIPNCKGVELLRNIVDSLHHDNYTCSVSKIPSILISGKNALFVVKALVNSLATEDLRETEACYFDCGINSNFFFKDTSTESVCLITEIEHLHKNSASVLWRYLKHGRCAYFNFMTQEFDNIIHSNGLIVLTTQNLKVIPPSIVKSVDHVVHLEPYYKQELTTLTEQYLKFCKIPYQGQTVVQEIICNSVTDIDTLVNTIRTCLVLLKSELKDYLTVDLVKKAQAMNALPVPAPAPKDDIPF